ncbi:MAG: electron transport complex subunit RsxC [Clostridium sp.]|uniref:electron transport complex subunit RsxC n=1 Tax=Clostridium sp. TaxID=1506 RepID=UPI002A895B8F|nr:electron transport complex subunit RsxC [Clostridium sp.]MDY5099156.1 electron transport complex subunit RsxC [Clostridium sp.]
MELLTFKKGVHPPHGKHLTEKKPIEEYLPKGDLVFPLSQHIGAPCTALVKKGDRVLVGQKIGEAGGFVSAPIYSSVSGTVKNVEPRMTSMGTKAMSIIVENDNLYEAVEKAEERDYEKLSNDEIVSIIKEAGIVGMGGATFPTHVKLTPPKDKTIDSIIVNAAECEPYLTCDHRLMLEDGQKIVEGLKIILKLFPEAKGYIGIENNKPDAIEAMTKLTANESRIEVKALKTKYPQGAEKQLIYAVTKREVPSGKLPADVSCIVQNVGTVYQIYKSVVQGEPLIERIVTVTGEAIKEPKNLKVKLGTSVQELIEEACGGFKEAPVKVISGGPMMGMTISTIEIPVTKGTSGILALTKDMAVLPDTSNCIRCGKCVEACPMNLLPTKLQSLSQRNELEVFESFHGLDCIECGCCTFVCPAKKNILQSIRVAKRAVLANKRKK